jgi:hypothetical protein
MRNRSKFCSTLLLIAAISVSLAAQTQTKPTIRVANTDLSWAMSKQVALDALKKNENNLVAPKDKTNLAWCVIDKEVKQASACLYFDEQGKLLRIDRNWTPLGWKNNADDFVQALYNLASQHEFGDCRMTTSHYSEPQGEEDAVLLTCQKGGIRITHSQVETEKGRLSTALLYEIIERPK